MLMRTHPLRVTDPITRMSRDLDRLFGTFIPIFSNGAVEGARLENFSPRMNVWEDETSYHFDVEVPGVPMDQIEVLATNDSITIKGHHAETTPENITSHVSERTFGAFERSVTFAGEINPDAIEARLERGLLHLSVQKADAARKTKKVQILSEHHEQTPVATS